MHDGDGDGAQHSPKGKSGDGRPRRRDRPKGLKAWDGKVINADQPLGRPAEGREYRDIKPSFEELGRGGRHTEDKVRSFQFGLEINARAINAYSEAVRDWPLQPATLRALDKVPELSDKMYCEALTRFVGLDSIETHAIALRDDIRRATESERLVQELERLLRIQKVLHKGLRDATLLAKRLRTFKRENNKKDRKPRDAVLVRTFTPFLLEDPTIVSAKQIEEIIEDPFALRPSSCVEMNELKIMAFNGQVNAASIYLDFDFMSKLLDLTIYAGAFALGARRPMTEGGAETYARMLCVGGEDIASIAARDRRAGYARALRARWREVPGLAASTEHLGQLRQD